MKDLEKNTSNPILYSALVNETMQEDEYIFDRIEVRAIFITLYALVFCCCFFGNLLVILVVTLSRRLRSITNFFLANLAVADLCVGVFCVLQNLSIYLIPSWVFGDFLCKMYQFVHSLSYTASIFILVVICMERYFAIIHPITCKQILTSRRLRLMILAVWITSALYSAPKFIYIETITVNITNGLSETICIAQRKKFNSEVYDVINFVFLYVLPLLVMTFLYTRIAVGLWQSSRKLECHLNASSSNIHRDGTTECSTLRMYKHRQSTKYTQTSLMAHDTTQVPTAATAAAAATANWKARVPISMSASSQNVLRARRRVIKMLIVVVLTFALCNLPFHARKMWQHWSSGYRGDSNFSTLFTPTTFLLTYFNSGINPMLYAFLSRKFRRGMRELLLCSIRSVQKHKARRHLLDRRCSGPLPVSQSSVLHVVGSVRSSKFTISTVMNGRCDSSTDGCSL